MVTIAKAVIGGWKGRRGATSGGHNTVGELLEADRSSWGRRACHPLR